MKSIKIIGAAGASIALLAGAGVQAASAASPTCSALDDPIYQVVNPKVGSSLLTPWAGEVTKAAKHGFTADRGVVFYGSTVKAAGLVGVHRLYNAKTQDFLFSISSTEIGSAVSAKGYVDQGTSFYVSPTGATGCRVGMPRLVKGTQHRVATLTGESATMTKAGWTLEGVRFYVATKGADPAAPETPAPTPTPTPTPSSPAASAGPFQFAVVPDTQLEVLKAGDARMKARNQWLVNQKVAFVAQTGDLVNWDTDAHEQYDRAKVGMGVLTANQTPYTVAVGNHDSMATGVGGSARPGKTWELVRDTRTLNHYFSAEDFGNVAGAFEPGKIDNVYATYQAGGKKFMVLTLEFAPRKAAVAWARSVVASHPDHNVIISTHFYLNGNNTISTSNGGYGDASGKYVFDNLVSQYPNIKMVFSGHVGYAAKARVDTGKAGNKVYSFLTTFHEGTTNPVRMLSVDTTKGTVSSTIYAPFDNKTWHAYDQTVAVDFV
ncbi:Calcineurin-like phosphoesterase [Friedmanniella luteola]|uniref:Calcineurin-like phosphoesterase n=1 Tax=Friedmanniella luteola TaxID=546871 RepID=A0A1H2ABR8_9ACTN|nr:metallophosphoesterase [Friedmanniella luteola]SDT43398.1 Calcineurin-like phosphoesterase [Friedmanniella luteola]